MNPTDPIAAVVHPDPYPYYAALTAGPPLVYHPELNLWLATRAASVAAVLADPACRVRPVAEPVPCALAGRPAGEIFARLVRMNDGPARHDAPKRALRQALDGADPFPLKRRARALAARRVPPVGDCAALNAWLFATPVTAIADWLGFTGDACAEVADWMGDFVACLSPLSTGEQLGRASDAARALSERMKALVASSAAGDSRLVGAVRRAARETGWRDADALIANLVGLLSQTYEATAGLLGNAWIASLTQRDAMPEQKGVRGPAQVEALVAETARYDPPVQNTRRFVAARTQVGDVTLEPGSAVLVLLAAANRDPAANPAPDRFLLEREARATFGFGRGMHRCPGERIAHLLAEAALDVLLAEGVPTLWKAPRWRYRPSANARLPVFFAAGGTAEGDAAREEPARPLDQREVPCFSAHCFCATTRRCTRSTRPAEKVRMLMLRRLSITLPTRSVAGFGWNAQ